MQETDKKIKGVNPFIIGIHRTKSSKEFLQLCYDGFTHPHPATRDCGQGLRLGKEQISPIPPK